MCFSEALQLSRAPLRWSEKQIFPPKSRSQCCCCQSNVLIAPQSHSTYAFKVIKLLYIFSRFWAAIGRTLALRNDRLSWVPMCWWNSCEGSFHNRLLNKSPDLIDIYSIRLILNVANAGREPNLSWERSDWMTEGKTRVRYSSRFKPWDSWPSPRGTPVAQNDRSRRCSGRSVSSGSAPCQWKISLLAFHQTLTYLHQNCI